MANDAWPHHAADSNARAPESEAAIDATTTGNECEFGASPAVARVTADISVAGRSGKASAQVDARRRTEKSRPDSIARHRRSFQYDRPPASQLSDGIASIVEPVVKSPGDFGPADAVVSGFNVSQEAIVPGKSLSADGVQDAIPARYEDPLTTQQDPERSTQTKSANDDVNSRSPVRNGENGHPRSEETVRRVVPHPYLPFAMSSSAAPKADPGSARRAPATGPFVRPGDVQSPIYATALPADTDPAGDVASHGTVEEKADLPALHEFATEDGLSAMPAGTAAHSDVERVESTTTLAEVGSGDAGGGNAGDSTDLQSVADGTLDETSLPTLPNLPEATSQFDGLTAVADGAPSAGETVDTRLDEFWAALRRLSTPSQFIGADEEAGPPERISSAESPTPSHRTSVTKSTEWSLLAPAAPEKRKSVAWDSLAATTPAWAAPEEGTDVLRWRAEMLMDEMLVGGVDSSAGERKQALFSAFDLPDDLLADLAAIAPDVKESSTSATGNGLHGAVNGYRSGSDDPLNGVALPREKSSANGNGNGYHHISDGHISDGHISDGHVSEGHRSDGNGSDKHGSGFDDSRMQSAVHQGNHRAERVSEDDLPVLAGSLGASGETLGRWQAAPVEDVKPVDKDSFGGLSPRGIAPAASEATQETSRGLSGSLSPSGESVSERARNEGKAPTLLPGRRTAGSRMPTRLAAPVSKAPAAPEAETSVSPSNQVTPAAPSSGIGTVITPASTGEVNPPAQAPEPTPRFGGAEAGSTASVGASRPTPARDEPGREPYVAASTRPSQRVTPVEQRYQRVPRQLDGASGAGTHSDSAHLGMAEPFDPAAHEPGLGPIRRNVAVVNGQSITAAMNVGPRNTSYSTLLPRNAPWDVHELEREFIALTDEMARILPPGHESSRRARHLLEKAQTIFATDPLRTAEVDYYMAQVRSILQRSRQTRQWSGLYQQRLVLYLGGWMALSLLVVGATLYYGNGFGAWTGVMADWLSEGSFSHHMIALAFILSAGALGGAVGGLLTLSRFHRLQLGFMDRKYSLRGLILPLMGLLVGAVLYGVAALLALVMEGSLPSMTWIMIGVAFLAFLLSSVQEMVYGTRE